MVNEKIQGTGIEDQTKEKAVATNSTIDTSMMSSTTLHKSNSIAASLSSDSVEGNFAELCSLSSPTLADYSPPSMLIDGKLATAAITTTNNITFNDPKAQEQREGASNITLVAKLFNSLQLADGKAAAYQRECESLKQRLRLIIDQREWAEQRLAEAETSQESRQDEYHTSVANYKAQLGTMSEHLASLNERLAAQQEEIDILNYERQMTEKRTEETTVDTGGNGKSGVLQANGSNKEGTLGANTVANRAKVSATADYVFVCVCVCLCDSPTKQTSLIVIRRSEREIL